MTTEEAPLRVEPQPDHLVLTGEIDAHTADALREALFGAPHDGDVRVDFSKVTFIDSSGLRVVLEVHQMLDRDGRRLVLLDPSRPVTRLVELAGLVSHLHIEPPLDATATGQFATGDDR
jgi:anti-sigma B factor antagonist